MSDDDDASDPDDDTGYHSPTPQLRRQLQECRAALSLSESRTLASTRNAAQCKQELEDVSIRARRTQAHIDALCSELQQAEAEAGMAEAARDAATAKLMASSSGTREAMQRFRQTLGQLEGGVAQRTARTQQQLQQLTLLVGELQHEAGGRGGLTTAPPRMRSLLRQIQQCLRFASQDAALPGRAFVTAPRPAAAAAAAAAASRVPVGSLTSVGGGIQELECEPSHASMATAAASGAPIAGTPSASSAAPPPRSVRGPGARKKSPVRPASGGPAAPPLTPGDEAELEAVARVAMSAAPVIAARAPATPGAAGSSATAAGAPPRGLSAAATVAAAAAAAAQGERAAEAEAEARQLRKDLKSAQEQLGASAGQEERAQELVGKYQEHIKQLQQTHEEREEALRRQLRELEAEAEAAVSAMSTAQAEHAEAIRHEMQTEMRLKLEAAAQEDSARRAAQREAEAASERELRRALEDTCATLSSVQAQREEQAAERDALQAALAQVRQWAQARELEAAELRRAADDQAHNYEAAADELHRTASQQQLLCTVLRQQLREATEQRQQAQDTLLRERHQRAQQPLPPTAATQPPAPPQRQPPSPPQRQPPPPEPPPPQEVPPPPPSASAPLPPSEGRLAAAGDNAYVAYTGGGSRSSGVAAGSGTAAAGDGVDTALREELRNLDTEMNSLHQSLYDAAVRFGAAGV